MMPIHPKQATFLNSTKPIVGCCSGRGGGKSVVGSIKIHKDARDGQSWMAVAPDYTQLSESTVPAFREVCLKMGRLIAEREKPYPRFIFITADRGTAEVVFRSGDDPDALRGPSKAGLWLDEASLMHEDVFKIAYPTLRWKGKMGQCFLTFTPRGRQHWTFKLFYQECDEDDPRRVFIGNQFYRLKDKCDLIRFRTLDNYFAPEDYDENIRSQYSTLLQAQELEGEFVDLQGLLFSRENIKAINLTDVPRSGLRVRYWDRAAGETRDSSYTASCLMCRPYDASPVPYIIEDVVRGQWSPKDRDEQMKKIAKQDMDRYGGEVIWFIEQEGGSGGKEVANIHVQMLAGYPVYIDRVGGQRFVMRGGLKLPGPAKTVRAMPAAAQVEARNVAYVRDGGWNTESFLEELTAFPESANSDQVDAFSGAFNKVAGIGLNISGTSHLTDQQQAEQESVGSRLLELQRLLRR